MRHDSNCLSLSERKCTCAHRETRRSWQLTGRMLVNGLEVSVTITDGKGGWIRAFTDGRDTGDEDVER